VVVGEVDERKRGRRQVNIGKKKMMMVMGGAHAVVGVGPEGGARWW